MPTATLGAYRNGLGIDGLVKNSNSDRDGQGRGIAELAKPSGKVGCLGGRGRSGHRRNALIAPIGFLVG